MAKIQGGTSSNEVTTTREESLRSIGHVDALKSQGGASNIEFQEAIFLLERTEDIRFVGTGIHEAETSDTRFGQRPDKILRGRDGPSGTAREV